MAPSEQPEAIEIRLLLEAIHARYGYDFRGYALESVERRIRATLARSGLPHLGELQHRLLTEPSLFREVLEGLTVQVSQFFRTPSLYRAFRERIAPVLRTYPRIKIWHAGCGAGEEPHSLAIVLFEEGLLERTQIYATDLSETALHRAKEGIYTESEIAEAEARYVEAGGGGRFADHCSRAYGHVAVHEELRKNIVFFRHDLVSDHSLGEMQVVFCRNVLIYFGPSLRERVLGMFEEGLVHGGFLCLGESEALPSTKQHAFAPFAPLERIYRRIGGA